MKKLILFFIIIVFVSCNTIRNTPVIINKYNTLESYTVDVTSDEDYNLVFLDYISYLKTYIFELVNQIKHKVNYIDLRSQKERKENK